MENEFFVTLLSNSSIKYHPDNKTSSFSVHLAKEINLEGKWSAALTEVSYPNLFDDVSPGNSRMIVRVKALFDGAGLVTFKEQKIDIDVDRYRDIHELVNKVNSAFFNIYQMNLFKVEEDGKPLTSFQKKTAKGEVKVDKLLTVNANLKDMLIDYYKDGLEASLDANLHGNMDNTIESVDTKTATKEDEMMKYGIESVDMKATVGESVCVYVEGRLAMQLGFPADADLIQYQHGTHRPNIETGTPLETFIYVDIVEPQIIADASSQVMRITKTLDGKTPVGGLITHEFLHRNYMSLIKNRFQSIQVELRDATGKFMPFQFGTSSATLHFKKNLLNKIKIINN